MTDDNLLYSILLQLKKQKDFVFLWNGKVDRENYRSFVFTDPYDIISAYNHSEIKNCFLKAEDVLSRGYYVAGYISYEAAPGFEDALQQAARSEPPLLWFGVYEKPIVYNHKRDCFGSVPLALALSPKGRGNSSKLNPYHIENVKPTKTKSAYLSDIHKVKDCIRKGDTYQVNYTFKYKFSFYGSPFKMFFDLNSKQSTPYAALISFDNKKILSLSPELFFREKKDTLKVKPMKGTIERGKNTFEDVEKQRQLEDSIKDKAENVMIVDMLRNDLGRISKVGTVKTTRLFETERYQTLYQMTSTVESHLQNKSGWYDIFRSIFPSGSVTGAPKIRTMQIINELEKSPRNVYTGSIGYISPEKEATFNVAIRTVELDTKASRGEIGIGSGITISSDANAEFQECKLKSDFFTKKLIDFQLIETLLWQNGKFFLLNAHLNRLKGSADYFDYKYSRDHILQSLINHGSVFKKHKSYKVRLLLKKGGEVKISSSAIKNGGAHPYITLAKRATDSRNIFLHHKTTNRKLYDDEYLKCKKKGFIDIIFCNERGEVTEGAISNIIIKNGRYYYTPPASCGLLNGAYRQHLLNAQTLPLKEKVLYKKDIITAEKLFICNSVRGLAEVRI